MELKYIREFVSLAETGSYFETSERLFITTSSLSRHIKALEEELGMPLFDRTTRKVELNRQASASSSSIPGMLELQMSATCRLSTAVK